MTQEEQIIELNSTVKCTLRQSKIHGVGVFALFDIKKGDKLYMRPNMFVKMYSVPFGSLNKLFPEIKEIILQRWASIVNGSHFTHPHQDAWLILFMNHRDDYNYEPSDDCAIKDIKKGEEITGDYRRMENYEKVFPWLKKEESIKETVTTVKNLFTYLKASFIK